MINKLFRRFRLPQLFRPVTLPRPDILFVLAEGAQRFGTLVDNLNVGVYRSVLDGGGRFIEVNQAMVTIMGYASAEELKQVPIAQAYCDPAERERMIGLVKAGGAVRNFEVRLRRKNGEVIWCALNIKGQFGPGGEVVWLDGVLEDISERKNGQERLKTALRELEDIIDFLPDATLVINLEHKVIAWNRAMEQMTGIRKADILGKGDFLYGIPFYGKAQPILVDLILDKIMDIDRERYGGIVRREDFLHAEAFAPCIFNGKGAHLSGNVTPLWDSDGHVIGCIESIRDVTSQVESERKVVNAAHEWRTTFDCMPDPIVIIDRDARIVRANAAFARRSGKNPEELVGMECREDKGGIAKYLAGILQEVLECRKSVFKELYIKDSDQYLEVAGVPVLEDSGRIAGVVHISRDVSERKELEKRQRLAQLGKLVADMAHEVNNPLMIISGNAQLSLMQDVAADELRHNLEIIIDESRRAKDIIQRLLKFSRPAKGEFTATDINKNIESIVSLIEHPFGLSNVAIVRDYGQGLPPVMIDEKQMQEVFINLLNNARDAMTSGGSVRISTAREGPWVRVSFADTGSGMDEETRRRIMEPFFTTKEKGTGLGLSVCFGIMKTHGGEMRFESKPGQGTTVTLLLPGSGGVNAG